ncbi:MAG: hypothetical protein H7Y31_09940 [Chitinophagaceae bacterium]|nr:hypothetical protein [Chitinophagaceae bacterium]
MKHFYVFFFAFMGFVCSVQATTYYSQGSLAPQLLSTWNTNRNGGGSSPSSFTIGGDEFIIQGNHVLYTTSIWTVGTSSSVLKIESSGVLYAQHPIFFNGFFQLLDYGTYYHDNSSSVNSAAGTSIFGGTEMFAARSRVEIRNWINNSTPLPAGVNWGTLVINYAVNLGGNWNQQGSLTNVQGDLLIKRTGTTNQDFRLTTSSSGSDVSTDGGKSWKNLDKENYNSVAAKGKNAIWAVGASGLVAKFSMNKK